MQSCVPLTKDTPGAILVQQLNAVDEICQETSGNRKRPDRIRCHRAARAKLHCSQSQFVTKYETKIQHRGKNSGEDTDDQADGESGMRILSASGIALSHMTRQGEKGEAHHHYQGSQ